MSINIDNDTSNSAPADLNTAADVTAMVKALGDGEKFKQDAFFFCGFPSEAPNEELMWACQKYVDMKNEGNYEAAVVNRLISELENALNKNSGLKDNMNITNSRSEIEAILALREQL